MSIKPCQPRLLYTMEELSGRIALAIGAFDGVHLGHQAILRRLVQAARESDATPVALFFDPLPREVLFPGKPTKMLTPFREKVRLMGEHGVEDVVVLPFTKELAVLSPQQFVSSCLLANKQLTIKAICIGEGWRFGAGNSGDVKLLDSLVSPSGIQVVEVPSECHAGTRISSSWIRNVVSEGDLSLASALLGRPYSLCGAVTHGKEVASGTLKCPTANISADALQLPPYGVYAAWTICGGSSPVPGIVYIGDAPTIRGEGNGHAIVEANLFGCSVNLYGRDISVIPVRFLRGSITFPNPEALSRQVARDVAAAKSALECKE